MYLGIEIGGTKLQLGIGPGDGTLTGLWRGGVDIAAGGPGIRQQIVAAVPELLASSGVKRSDLRAVGVGFGGPVDDATRSVLKSHQVGGWEGFPLAEWAEQALKLPASLGNDADCAALAEALFGARQGLVADLLHDHRLRHRRRLDNRRGGLSRHRQRGGRGRAFANDDA